MNLSMPLMRGMRRLIALMREDATSEMIGLWIEDGREAIGGPGKSNLHHTFASSDSWRAESHEHESEQIILLWTQVGGKEAFSSVARLKERDGLVSQLRYYTFCPDALA